MAGRGFRGGGASLEGLAARSALLWFWEGRRLAVLSSRASLLPIPLGCLEGSRNAGAGVCMSPPVCDKGQIPGVLSVPTRPNQGLERSSLQGWKCGFICLGLRCLLTFSGLVLERGARRAGAWWCAGARCLSGCGRWWCQEGPVGQGRVDRGRVQVSNSQTAALCDRPPRSSLRPGGPLGSLVAPASGDVEGVQGPAGEQGKVVAIPSGACGRAGMSGCLLRLFPRLA